MNTLRQKLYRFMAGRYGYDDLNYTMLGGALLLNIVGMLTRTTLCMTLALVLLILLMIRALSKNRVKRIEENRRFRAATVVPRRLYKAVRLGRADKAHRYYLCPKCHQICRVPAGRGQVSVHCPGCGQEFSRRS